MLNLKPTSFGSGDSLPFGWHFFLLGGATPRTELRKDGFPGFGVPMPDMSLPRLLLGGRAVECQGAIKVGSSIRRTSRLAKIREKEAPTGKMAIVEIENIIKEVDGSATIRETQTYLLLEAASGAVAPPPEMSSIQAEFIKKVTPDDTLLFQYSALGFNSHKIHLDRAYAQEVEGLPDLVVNGGLVTLLVTEAMRIDLGLRQAALTTRHIAPLYVNRELTIAADRSDQGWYVRVYDHSMALAATMEISCA
ncbi:FAS1-like dehydratase domain-containing protein [Roseinatronobacter sp. NSM]|uniref:FAS1-like dehydratase domain-containing protein n=1 Tax=Roseinatronobacter sp. NSM TaxID=3457785 RepID=UPI0040364DB0